MTWVEKGEGDPWDENHVQWEEWVPDDSEEGE